MTDRTAIAANEIAPKADASDESRQTFLLSEHAALRAEIIDRLDKRHKLTTLLYGGAIVYLTTLFAPLEKISSLSVERTSVNAPVDLLLIGMIYISAVIILPLVGLSIEILSESESDAIARCGVYIRDQIERKLNASGYRGWEDWLDRQDKSSRRRTSERMAKLARRLMIIIYSGASSLISGYFIANISGVSQIPIILSFMAGYALCIWTVFRTIERSRSEEFSTTFYGVLSIDVDGCLLDSNRQMSQRSIAAIQEVSRRGVNVIIASGRSHHSLAGIVQQLGITGQHAAGNGAVILDSRNSQVRVISPISPDAVAEIAKTVTGLQIHWAAFGKSAIFVIANADPEEVTQTEKELLARGDITSTTKVFRISDLSSYRWDIDDKNVFKVWCFLSRQDSRENRLKEIKLESAHICRTTDETVEFFAISTSKIDAVRKIISELGDPIKGEPEKKVLAIGDNDNDLEIMRWAHHAVAPANASLNVKQLISVDVQPVTNDEDFIAEVIETYYQIYV